MKILYLCQRIPYPPDRGDRIAAFHQIRHLRNKHDVVVGSLATGGSAKNVDGLVKELGVRVICSNQSVIHQIHGMAQSMLWGRPLTLGHFKNRNLQRRINALLSQERFDAILVFSSSMAQYVEFVRDIPRIMHFCDLDSQKWTDLSESRKGPMRWIYSREGRLLLKYERKIAHAFNYSCFVTDHEAQLFRKYIPDVPVNVLENGVDVDFFSSLPWSPSDLNLVFVGVMDYPPNVEAVTYFVEKIWPSFITKHKHARFRIVGSRPSRSVQRLASQPGIEVTGYVSDIRPYLASATMLVAPLEIARGVQNKVLEAMAAGVPVLTTPVVAKGLPPGAESAVFVEERSAFSSALLDLAANQDACKKKAADAQDLIMRSGSWEHKLGQLDRLLEKCGMPGSLNDQENNILLNRAHEA
jgi:sugar transferase (PEP-CTERM/EpsH1 system associated)